MMRRTLFLPLIAIAAACAPRISSGPQPVVSPVAEVVLAGGPEGESPMPGSAPTAAPESPARRPALASVAAVPSARIAAALEQLSEKHLLIPVTGVEPSRIEDSFTAGRDGDRQHNALDILAPRNTPIVAADDGVILRMSSNALGGITIYAADRDHRFVYYYAHLDHYRGGLSTGKVIQKGDTLGYVGTTGNAPKDVPHLHFQIMLWAADGKWWQGEPVNPYPILKSATPSGGARLRFY